MNKIPAVLSLLLILTACHKKAAPPVTVQQAIAVLNSSPPETVIASLDEGKNDFKKPVYNSVPDHSTSLADTAVSDMTVSGAVTYALSSATAFAATDNNGSSGYAVQTASIGGFSTTANADKTEPAFKNVVNKTSAEKAGSQVVKNATVTFQVKDADSSHGRVAALLDMYDAYTVIDKRTQSTDVIQQKMQIRVTPAKFEKLIAEIMKESVYTEVKDISADDVTAQYVDMETRLRSKKDVEKRYTDLLNRAQRINDIIVIENNRRYIREEIESLEGNLRLLQDQIAFSTIYLTLSQKLKQAPIPVEPEAAEASFGAKVKAALVTGWRGIEFFALFLLNIWPLLLASVPITIWLVRVYKTPVVKQTAQTDEE